MKQLNKMLILTTVVNMGLMMPAFALTDFEKQQLEQLDPQTRLEQRCDIEAMNRLRNDQQWRPDKVLAYAYGDPKISETKIKAPGAAFRSRGKWYRLSYECITAADALTIRSFSYKIGDIIPRNNWDAHYLVP